MKIPPPPPYEFRFAKLSDEKLAYLKSVPGVHKVIHIDGREKIVWQPFNDNPWDMADRGNPKWIKGAEKIYDVLAIKEPIGGTQWDHGGLTAGSGSDVVIERRGRVSFFMVFKNGTVLDIRCYNQAAAGQVEHEMLRNIPGTAVSVEKCGEGYVIVSRGSRGVIVVWQINTQMFVRINNFQERDRELAATFIRHLGCTTTEEFSVKLDKWVDEEIHWRILYLNQFRQWELDENKQSLFALAPSVTTTFPDIFAKYGILRQPDTLETAGEWLKKTRLFLWANRGNFKYDDANRGYVLKGKDRFDPNNPPELPEELRGIERPADKSRKVK